MSKQTLLEELKLKYGKVNTLIVPLDEDDNTKVADRTSRKIIGDLAQKDVLKAVEAGLKALYIGGDSLELITKNDDALVSCTEPIIDMLEVQKATLKKN